MNITQELIVEIEAAAKERGCSPSTIGEKAGQGGRFYARLLDGKRVWPETAEKVRDWIKHNASPKGGEYAERDASPQHGEKAMNEGGTIVS